MFASQRATVEDSLPNVYSSFEFLVMPIGQSMAPAHSSLHEPIFRDMTDIFIVIYLTTSSSLNSLEEHRVHVQRVLECLAVRLHSNPRSLVPHAEMSSWASWSHWHLLTWPRPMLSCQPTPIIQGSPVFLGFATSIPIHVGFSDIIIPDSPDPQGHPIHLGP